MSKLSNFISSSRRILSISKKPTNKEFWMMAKIIGLGIILIGVVGYLIKLIVSLF